MNFYNLRSIVGAQKKPTKVWYNNWAPKMNPGLQRRPFPGAASKGWVRKGANL